MSMEAWLSLASLCFVIPLSLIMYFRPEWMVKPEAQLTEAKKSDLKKTGLRLMVCSLIIGAPFVFGFLNFVLSKKSH